jgi:hypothetical protein
MLKRTQIFIVALLLVVLVGCGAFLETEREFMAPRTPEPYVPVEVPPGERIELVDGYELGETILYMIHSYENTGLFVMYNNDFENFQEEAERIARDIQTNDPIGAYATSGISVTIDETANYIEIDVIIEFRRTQEQIDSIINVATTRYLRTELLRIMRGHRDEVAFRTSLNITEEDIREIMAELYYENPRSIIMLPVVAVDSFPSDSGDRIVELLFGHIEPSSILQQYAESLASNVRYNAGLAIGGTDGEILLTLVRNLVASTSFDEAAARAISEHGPQNFAATAFGALVRQSAVGEGFAMAFKALTDELGFESRIVLGYRDGMVHAWNIVSLFGYYYHIDVAMSAVYGIETGFLKTDDDFIEMLYEWDFENTVRANGTLTYQDIVYLEREIEYNDVENDYDNDYDYDNYYAPEADEGFDDIVNDDG